MNNTIKNKIASILLKDFRDKNQAIYFIEENFPNSIDGTIYLRSFDSKSNLLTFDYQLRNRYGNGKIEEILTYFSDNNTTLKVSCNKDLKDIIEKLPSLDRFVCDRVELIPFQKYKPCILCYDIYDNNIGDNIIDITVNTEFKLKLSNLFDYLNEIINDNLFEVFADIRNIIEESK